MFLNLQARELSTCRNDARPDTSWYISCGLFHAIDMGVFFKRVSEFCFRITRTKSNTTKRAVPSVTDCQGVTCASCLLPRFPDFQIPRLSHVPAFCFPDSQIPRFPRCHMCQLFASQIYRFPDSQGVTCANCLLPQISRFLHASSL